jgi:heme A synthase
VPIKIQIRNMIQRIQSLYLLFASALMGGSYYLPYGRANVAPEANLLATNAFADGLLTLQDSQTALGCVIVAAIFCLIAIFRYQNRIRQIITSWVALAGGILGIGVMGMKYFQDGNPIAAQLDLGGGCVILALLLIILAIRAMRKDENLVRSMDRLR